MKVTVVSFLVFDSTHVNIFFSDPPLNKKDSQNKDTFTHCTTCHIQNNSVSVLAQILFEKSVGQFLII